MNEPHYRVTVKIEIADTTTGEVIESTQIASDTGPYLAALKRAVVNAAATNLQFTWSTLGPAAQMERIRANV